MSNPALCEQCGELPATVFAALSKDGKEQETQAESFRQKLRRIFKKG